MGIMTIANENSAAQNTPRTRNHVLDNTQLMSTPDNIPVKGDWTFRRQLEADFRALGFKSHKFSHKNEPETRSADSLWFSWNSDSKKRPIGAIVTDIEVRVTFAIKGQPYYTDYETIITITHEGRERHACIARRMGKAVFTLDWINSDDVMAHINYLLSK
jgi:hypothetical protein